MSLSPLTSGALHALFAGARGGGKFNRRGKRVPLKQIIRAIVA